MRHSKLYHTHRLKDSEWRSSSISAGLSCVGLCFVYMAFFYSLYNLRYHKLQEEQLVRIQYHNDIIMMLL